MPIVEFHLSAARHDDAAIGRLLVDASQLYAEVLQAPIERVRAVAHTHQPCHVAVAGRLQSEGGELAPYFHFLVLEGRPVEQCQRLLGGFTDLCVSHLGVARGVVRGGCWPIAPEYWAIAGNAASVMRAREIAERASAAG